MVAGFAQASIDGAREEKTRLSQSGSAPLRITFLHRAAGFVGATYLRFVQSTSAVLRWDHPRAMSMRRRRTPGIYAFWHNKQVYLAVDHKHEGTSVMVSRSKDGEYIAQVMLLLGIHPVRGSTNRGGENALRGMMSQLERGSQLGFTPDGPRGPLHTVHGGVVHSAQNAGVPIIPTTYIASRRQEFNSWDRFILPLPFGRIVVAHGEPMLISKDLDIEIAKQKLHDAMMANENDAEQILSKAPTWFQDRLSALAFFLYGMLAMLLGPFVALGLALVFGFKRGARFLGERFSGPPLGKDAPIWFHAASVGEWQALKPVLKELRLQAEFAGDSLLVTVSTPEARTLISKEDPTILVRMMPLDICVLTDIWFKRLRPKALVIVETELWPNLLLSAARAFVPIILINGRLSDRSFGRWKRFRPLIQHLLFKLTEILARTDDDAQRFRELGAAAGRVHVSGNTKIDNVQLGTTARVLQSPGPVIIGGSTWPTEEALLISMMREAGTESLRLILAPRRLERIPEIQSLLKQAKLSFSLYSEIKKGSPWNSTVLLVNTLGDLKNLYSSADVAFVGGSVFPQGGQNPLEPACAGLPMVWGSSMSNFRSEASKLVESQAAFMGVDEADVKRRLLELLRDDDLRRRMGEAASQTTQQQRGASARTALRLCELLRNT